MDMPHHPSGDMKQNFPLSGKTSQTFNYSHSTIINPLTKLN